MKKINNSIVILLSMVLLIIACKKNEPISDLDKLRQSNNKKSYPVTKMDSTEAIKFIINQKTQELFDLSTLYISGNRDTEIDSVIYTQMENYFLKPDSTKLKPLLTQIDSLKANSAKVSNLSVNKSIHGKDTLDYAKFNVEFFDKNNKSVGNFTKNAEFVLKLNPVKFKKEFKFYFIKFDVEIPKDSTSVGVTKKSKPTS